MARRVIAGLVAAVLVSFAGGGVDVDAQRASVSGTATYRERMTLPPGAELEVTLEDVSRADTSSVVTVARVRQQVPSGPPITFDLPYEPGRIDPRHRYAVRLRIVDTSDDDRVLFESTGTTLVVTQGHGTRATVVLAPVSAPRPVSTPAPATTALRSRPAVAPLPAAVPLRDLPATFVGTLPCADCPGIRYELNLFPDDSYLLRTTRLGRDTAGPQDDLGSWVLSSDRRMIRLEGGRGTAATFVIRDHRTLTMVAPERTTDSRAARTGEGASGDLRRSATFAPLEVRTSMTGVYRVEGARAEFTECLTGQTWVVLDQAAHASVRAALSQPGRREGQPLSVSIEGRLETRRRAGRPGVESALVVERLVGTLAPGSCARRFAALPLAGTNWRLTGLDGSVVPAVAQGQATVPALTFREDPGTFSGAGGCHRFTGPYEVRGETLTLISAGTLRVCPGLSPAEAAFKNALTDTRGYRILGDVLELYDEDRQLVARFEGR